MTEQKDIVLLDKLGEMKTQFLEQIGKSVIGQQDVLNHILIALLCKGHTLIVGVPGLAKTLIIKSMAELLDMNFKRIQFTPDLMPSDITGTEVIDDDKKIDFDELYENALEERPYIADPKQLSFYFSRNIKTFISVSILLYIAVKAFQMFLNSFNLFIDNLL